MHGALTKTDRKTGPFFGISGNFSTATAKISAQYGLKRQALRELFEKTKK
jgi:hypothetical protein